MDEGIDLSALVGTLAPLVERVKNNPNLLSGALSLLSPGEAEVHGLKWQFPNR